MAGMHSVFAEDDEGLVSDINVTPLVDVVLVLLFIFMVTAPLLTMSLDVEVPEVSTATPAPPSAVVVSVAADGTIKVDDRAMLLDEAVALAVEKSKAPGGGAVYVQGDRRAPYGDVAAVLDRLRLAGVGNASLVTEIAPDEPAPAPPRGRRRQ